ncbi:MAG: tetratricopeptide repeat protein [Sedimentisphaerales bacterium]
MDHNHTNCCCNHYSKDQTRIARKRIFSLGFVLVIVLLIKPFMADQLIKRADAYYTFGFYDDAIRQYKKAILLSKADSDIWINLGDCFKAKSEVGEAIAAFREAVNVAPEDRAANFNLGMALAMSKNYNSAVAYFEKVRSFGAESKEQRVFDGFSYYRSSLKMLAICLEKLHEFEKEAIVREEFKLACRGDTLACEK